MDPTKVAGPTPDDFENAGVPLCRCVATPLPYDDALGSLTWSEINSYVNDLNKHGKFFLPMALLVTKLG